MAEKKPAISIDKLEAVEGISLDDLLDGVTLDDAPTPEKVVDKPVDDLDTVAEVEPPKKATKKKAVEKPAPVVDDDLPFDMPEPTTPIFDKLAKMPGIEVAPAIATTAPTPYDPFEALITNVGDAPEYVTIVAYGKNGTGKTTFGASGDQTLVLEVEKDGTFSVRDRGSKAKKVQIRTWADVERAYWWLVKNPGRFKILCIDTLTRLLELCIRDIVLGDKAANAELMDNDIIKVTLPQRGDIAQKMKFWLNAFNNLPMHKAWLCQEASGSDDADVRDFEVYPDLSRSVRTYVCSDATVIGRMMIKLVDKEVDGKITQVPSFRMVVKPSDKWLSKDRTNVLGAGVINPKLDEIVDKIYSK